MYCINVQHNSILCSFYRFLSQIKKFLNWNAFHFAYDIILVSISWFVTWIIEPSCLSSVVKVGTMSSSWYRCLSMKIKPRIVLNIFILFFLHITVTELKNARLTLTLYSSGITQPIVQCNMALEPHCNTDFKTGAGFEKRTTNAEVMAKKLNLIWNPNR